MAGKNEHASGSRARSRTRARRHVRALIAAIQGKPESSSSEEHLVARNDVSKVRLARTLTPARQRSDGARAHDGWRADCCRARLEAAREPAAEMVGGDAAEQRGSQARAQLGPQPRRNAASGPRSADPTLTHALLITGSVTWCRTCGAYADLRVRGLRGRCPGPPTGPGGSGRTALRRLLEGRHPLSGLHFGEKTLSLR